MSRSEFWDMLATLRKFGITILVSTSYMDEATRCDRIAMIDHGKILRTDTPEGLVAGLDENLYNAVSSDMFRLLAGLRKLPQVIDCYTFGATLHVVGSEDFRATDIKRKLEAQGISDVDIYPAKGVIEDLFIKLTRNDQQ